MKLQPIMIELVVATWDYKWRIESVNIPGDTPVADYLKVAKQELGPVENVAHIGIHLTYNYNDYEVIA